MKFNPKTNDLSFKICSPGTWMATQRWILHFLHDEGGGILTPSMLQFHKFVPDSRLIASKFDFNAN